MDQIFPFYTALTHVNDFYGISLDDDDFENYGLHAWDKIGNKYTSLHKFCSPTVNKELMLPCNSGIVELVTEGLENYQSTDNTLPEDYRRLEIEQYIEARKGDTSPMYHRGRMVPFQQLNDRLIFNKDYNGVTVLYKGLILDDDGLPQINFKEVEAIALYCAYVHTQKKGMMTKDKATLELAIGVLLPQWQRACDAARTPIYLNQNDVNEIMNVKSNWDRKRYNVSFKLYT